ncbi:DUF7344 domain-containing protein [Haloarcula marina]|uniref:DUF7344 domain-containing protein n=1 Tax=Haloarcula marina TaxID=2961574 RepID=UPI0020B8B554|nr:hypothetical protein [Halomicroarcula marina]
MSHDAAEETVAERPKCVWDDQTLSLLASARRRTVVAVLAEAADTTHTLDSLAARVAEREAVDGGEDVPTHRVTADLHHVHLPKLDAAGVLEYDSDQRTVVARETARLESLLDVF